MENLKKIFDSSENYAAIYARISSKTDNNSINGQITLAKEVAKKHNLLIYSCYTDHTSAKTKSPQERTGFSRLLEDAKAGCFKTIIIYRLDRLVRNFNHWVNIKQILTSLGIKIIYSDESQISPNDSSYNEFLQNLTVMVAEMEPNTINLRTSEGKKIRRKQGAYNSAYNVPFGYTRHSRNTGNKKVDSKSIFISEPIKIDFIKYLFLEFNNYIALEKKDITGNYIASLDNLLESSNETLNNIILNLESNSIIQLDNNSPSHYKELINCFNSFILSNGKDSLLKILNKIKFHYFIEKKSNKKKNPGNFYSALKNPIYSGYMLLDSNHLCKGLKYTSLDNDNTNIIYKEHIDESAFVKTNNLEGIVPYKVFKTVYSYLTFQDLGRIDKSKNFLFKNKIKCSCTKKFSLIDDFHLSCGNPNCCTFYKDDLIEFILYNLIRDILSTSTSNFEAFNKKIISKINLFESNIRFNKLGKFKILETFISSDDNTTPNSLINKDSLVSANMQLCNEYRKRLSYIKRLKESIFSFSDKDTDLELQINSCIDYILKNEDMFSLLFNELIKEIKVITNGKLLNGKIKIKYEFPTAKLSNISKSFN